MGILSKTRSLCEFLGESINYKLNRARFKNISINITGKCNLDCLFCECRSLDSSADLTYDELTSFFTDMAGKGVSSVFIGGGEPFMRKDIWDILSFLHKMGYEISIVSNGFLLANASREKLNILNKTVSNLTMSLDSHMPDLHNYYRNNNAAFDNIIRAIDNITALSETRLLLTMIITNDNYMDMPEIVKFAKEHGVGSVSFQPFSDSTNFPDVPAKEKKSFLLSAKKMEELKTIYDATESKAQELGVETNLKFSRGWIFEYFANKDRGCAIFQNMVNRFECILPFDDLYIRHNGDVQLCALLPKISSVRGNSLDEVMIAVKEHRRLLQQGKFPPECRRCFCGLNRNVRFSILLHPIINYYFLQNLVLQKCLRILSNK